MPFATPLVDLLRIKYAYQAVLQNSLNPIFNSLNLLISFFALKSSTGTARFCPHVRQPAGLTGISTNPETPTRFRGTVQISIANWGLTDGRVGMVDDYKLFVDSAIGRLLSLKY
jgi:hypothetical protein